MRSEQPKTGRQGLDSRHLLSLGPLSPDLASRWILGRLAGTADEINAALEDYRFNDAANSIYHFIWHEFCDWYIEMSKTEISNPGSMAGGYAVPALYA